MDIERPSIGQVVVLATSSAVTLFLYSIYKRKATAVDVLKNAKEFSIDQDLKNILSETPGRCVPYAVIEGAVRPVKETLSSRFDYKCKGVIVRQTLKEKKMVWNVFTYPWNCKDRLLFQHIFSVPFTLGSHDEGTAATVQVTHPQKAEWLDLDTTYCHRTVPSWCSTMSHIFIGKSNTSILETEEMLLLGDSITGVGELVLDNNLIKLQPPKQGLPYFLTHLEYKSLLRKQMNSVRLWRILTTVCSIAAFSTLLFILWKQYIRHREYKERRMLEEGVAEGNECVNST